MSDRKRRPSTLRWGLRALVPLLLLSASDGARADNLLRRAPTPGAVPLPGTPAQLAAASAAAVQQNQGIRRSLDAIRAWQAAQETARTAAQLSASGVPDGLGLGGLQIDPGGTWTGAGAPTQASLEGGTTEVTIAQTASRAVLGWTTFNVGKRTEVYFDQTAGKGDASSWVVLNRVLDPGGVPSQILGSIKAEGQVYLLNRNGILFGGASQVNVGTLVLSGLEIVGGDKAFLDAKQSLAALSFANAPVNGADPAATVTIAAGARISTSPFGRVVLLGRDVENAGSIESDDGQIFLAAAKSITLAPAPDLGLVRGLGVPALGDQTGTVVNTGVLSTARGNITLAGGLTVQAGLVTATTSAQANGSIYVGGSGVTEFKPGSSTQILPDLTSGKVLGTGSDYKPSDLEVTGDRIYVDGDLVDAQGKTTGGAVLYAPGGRLNLLATMPCAQSPCAAPASADPLVLDDSRIYLGSGARLDVSGLRDVWASMEVNSVKAELRANELRDNPVLRDGPLRGRTIYFDLRQGGSLESGYGVADLGGYYDLIQRDVSQLMTVGGSIGLSANQVIARAGSTLDVSGGSVRYTDGYVRSSALLDSAGKKTPIEQAVAGWLYLGVDGDFIQTHPRWGVTETFSSALGRTPLQFERGYLQGGSAGAVAVGTNAPGWYLLADPIPTANPSATNAVLILDGEIAAGTVAGAKQRSAPTGSTDPAANWSQQAGGATLVLANAGDVSFSDGGPLLPAGFSRDGAVDPSLLYKTVLPGRWFDGHTIRNLAITAGKDLDVSIYEPTHDATVNRAPGGHFTIGAGVVVDLGDGGTLSFDGKSASIDGTLLAPGGKVTLGALQLGAAGDKLASTIHLGATGVIDVAGRLTNDALDGLGAPLRALAGGAVSLSGVNIDLDAGSLIDVSGGARLDPAGSKLTAGAGGTISLNVAGFPAPLPAGFAAGGACAVSGPGCSLVLGGNLFGYSLATGGALKITVGGDVEISAAAPLFKPAFFTGGGFSSYSLHAANLSVAAGTLLSPTVSAFLLPEGLGSLPSGTRLADVAGHQVVLDPSGNGAAMKLSLTADQTLSVGAGAVVFLAPGSAVGLTSSGLLDVEGTVQAPGGSIALASNNGAGSRVLVGPGAQLLAAGYLTSQYVNGVLVRSVAAGGSVTVVSGGDLEVDRGATIDVSGVAGTADLLSPAASGDRYLPTQVSGSAGSVNLQAQTGLVDGHLHLGPGDDTGAGGSLSISTAENTLLVAQHSGAAAAPQTLTVIAQAIDDSRADDVTLQAGKTNNAPIAFDGNVDLEARRSLTLRSGELGSTAGTPVGAQVLLAASHVSLIGQADNVGSDRVDGSDLRATLTVKADLIDVAETVLLGCPSAPCAVRGFKEARLLATGDLRLSNHDPAAADPSTALSPFPGLLSAGPLELQAAQVYVSSQGHLAFTSTGVLERAADDPGFLVESDQKITVERPPGAGDLPAAPLSFGERLTLQAPDIEQNGVLRSPLGQIRLVGGVDASGAPTGNITLSEGSVTSVALPPGSLVPFGLVQTGGVFLGYDTPGAAPVKAVQMTAANVSVKAGAVVDVSGGGDLLGYTVIPGNGGSYDVLEPQRSASGAILTTTSGAPLAAPSLGKNLAAPFAVVPGWGSSSAPVGPVASLNDPRLKVGDQVWLQGVPGLAAGYYTLLPAHYALLGGFLVQPLGGGYASAPGTYQRADGAYVTGGRLSHLVLGDAATQSHQRIDDPGFTQFVVMGPDVFSRYSDIVSYSFNGYARTLAAHAGVGVRTPFDAGSLVLRAGASLTLDGTGRFGAEAGGLLGDLDISAPRIAVVSPETKALFADYLTLDAKTLSSFGAGSVLLGGTRAPSADPSLPGTVVTVDASSVVIDTGSEALAGAEVILAAKDVSVRDGSTITVSRGQGAVSSDKSALLLSGDGALLRLSTGERVGLVRTASTGASGTLEVGDATLSASGSLAFEGSSTVGFAPGIALSSPQIDLASDRVSLGDAPAGASGTVLSAALISRLAGQSDLLIRGQEAIQLYGNLTLGGGAAGTTGITLDTPLLEGEGGATVSIDVGRLALRNSGAAQAGGTKGVGTLQVRAGELDLGPGTVALGGFSAVTGSVGTLVVSDAAANSARPESALDVAGDLSLSVGRIGATSGSSYTIATGGTATFSQGAASGAAPASLGGRLVVAGKGGVVLDTEVSLPAGSFQATSSEGGVTLLAHAAIDVSGRAVDLAGQVRFAPGGAISLSAAKGALDITAGASLDVSGAAQGGDAGAIALLAGGAATVDGALSGGAAAGYLGGAFSLDAASVGAGPVLDLAALNAKLDVTRPGFASSFDASRRFEVRAQDLLLAAGSRIAAHEVVLSSEHGKVTVDGVIDASGTQASPDGGRIALAGAAVTLSGTLDAHAWSGALPADAFDPASGAVLLSATAQSVDVTSSARIDLTGGRSASGSVVPGGSLVLRAPRKGSDLALDLAGAVVGERQVLVQGVAEYDFAAGTVLGSGALQPILAAADGWLLGAGAIASRLSAANPNLTGLQIGAGLQLNGAGDLTLKDDVLLNGRLGAGFLGISAKGDLNLNGSISDGFDDAGALAARLPITQASLSSAASASYGLTSGGSITLAKGALVRTGTGAISLQAAVDLHLLDATSVIYTAGRKTARASGFDGAPAGALLGELPTGGGDIDLSAGRDIVAPRTTQTTSAWLFRQGTPGGAQTSWSIVFKNFQQGVGALGGGDVRIRAGEDVVNLQVSLPSTGQLTTPRGSTPQAADLVVRGGGDLRLDAGRDISGGLFMLGRGHAALRAGRGAGAEPDAELLLRSDIPDYQASNVYRKAGLLFGLGDATATVTAGSTTYIEGAFDPMRQGQIAENLAGGAGAAFRGYTDRTSLEVLSAGGSVRYENDPWASADLSLAVAQGPFRVAMRGGADSLNGLFSVAPPALRLASLASTVTVEDHFRNPSTLTLASAPRGTLELLAVGDVDVERSITEQEIAPAFERGPLAPFETRRDALGADRAQGLLTDAIVQRGGLLVHAGDPVPARIYSLDGSVCFGRSAQACVPGTSAGTLVPVDVTLAKPLEVFAGVDVLRGVLRPQNNGSSDVSFVIAGRDVYQPIVLISGPGTLVVQAGRDVTLSQGISSSGKDPLRGGAIYSLGNVYQNDDLSGPTPGNVVVNPALAADKAADVLVVAGAPAGAQGDKNAKAFAAAYLDPANQVQRAVHDYLEPGADAGKYLTDPVHRPPDLRTFLSALDPKYAAASEDDLVSAFAALPLQRRQLFLDRVYLSELNETGLDYTDPASPRYQSYARGDRAVSLLFPTDPALHGKIALNGKPVVSRAAADLTLLAPYGGVAVGASIVPAGFSESAFGGVVTQRGGSIRIMADEDIALFTSRVFTLQGGDILLWTSNGGVSAGSGSKTSVSHPPLAYTIDSAGVIAVDAFGLSTGAGIGVLDALGDATGRTPSALDIVAPRGEVNAGDAGIRAVGNLNIAAAAVVGAENITSNGNVTGVPKIEAPNLGQLTSASQIAQAAVKQGVGPDAQAKTALSDLPSIITVEVVGYETSDPPLDPKRKQRPGGASDGKPGGPAK